MGVFERFLEKAANVDPGEERCQRQVWVGGVDMTDMADELNALRCKALVQTKEHFEKMKRDPTVICVAELESGRFAYTDNEVT